MATSEDKVLFPKGDFIDDSWGSSAELSMSDEILPKDSNLKVTSSHSFEGEHMKDDISQTWSTEHSVVSDNRTKSESSPRSLHLTSSDPCLKRKSAKPSTYLADCEERDKILLKQLKEMKDKYMNAVQVIDRLQNHNKELAAVNRRNQTALQKTLTQQQTIHRHMVSHYWDSKEKDNKSSENVHHVIHHNENPLSGNNFTASNTEKNQELVTLQIPKDQEIELKINKGEDEKIIQFTDGVKEILSLVHSQQTDLTLQLQDHAVSSSQNKEQGEVVRQTVQSVLSSQRDTMEEVHLDKETQTNFASPLSPLPTGQNVNCEDIDVIHDLNAQEQSHNTVVITNAEKKDKKKKRFGLWGFCIPSFKKQNKLKLNRSVEELHQDTYSTTSDGRARYNLPRCHPSNGKLPSTNSRKLIQSREIDTQIGAYFLKSIEIVYNDNQMAQVRVTSLKIDVNYDTYFDRFLCQIQQVIFERNGFKTDLEALNQHCAELSAKNEAQKKRLSRLRKQCVSFKDKARSAQKMVYKLEAEKNSGRAIVSNKECLVRRHHKKDYCCRNSFAGRNRCCDAVEPCYLANNSLLEHSHRRDPRARRTSQLNEADSHVLATSFIKDYKDLQRKFEVNENELKQMRSELQSTHTNLALAKTMTGQQASELEKLTRLLERSKSNYCKLKNNLSGKCLQIDQLELKNGQLQDLVKELKSKANTLVKTNKSLKEKMSSLREAQEGKERMANNVQRPNMFLKSTSLSLLLDDSGSKEEDNKNNQSSPAELNWLKKKCKKLQEEKDILQKVLKKLRNEKSLWLNDQSKDRINASDTSDNLVSGCKHVVNNSVCHASTILEEQSTNKTSTNDNKMGTGNQSCDQPKQVSITDSRLTVASYKDGRGIQVKEVVCECDKCLLLTTELKLKEQQLQKNNTAILSLTEKVQELEAVKFQVKTHDINHSDKLENEKAKLVEEVRVLKDRVAENQELCKIIEELKQKNSSMKDEIGDLNGQLARLSRDSDDIANEKEENLKLSSKLVEKENRLKELTDKSDCLKMVESENERLRGEVLELKERKKRELYDTTTAQKMQEENERLEEELSALKTSFISAQEKTESLDKEVRNLKTENSRLIEKLEKNCESENISELQKDVDHLELVSQELRIENQGLLTELQSKEETTRDLVEKNTLLESNIKDLNEKFSQASQDKEEIFEFKEQVDILQQNLVEKTEEIEDLQASLETERAEVMRLEQALKDFREQSKKTNCSPKRINASPVNHKTVPDAKNDFEEEIFMKQQVVANKKEQNDSMKKSEKCNSKTPTTSYLPTWLQPSTKTDDSEEVTKTFKDSSSWLDDPESSCISNHSARNNNPSVAVATKPGNTSNKANLAWLDFEKTEDKVSKTTEEHPVSSAKSAGNAKVNSRRSIKSAEEDPFMTTLEQAATTSRQRRVSLQPTIADDTQEQDSRKSIPRGGNNMSTGTRIASSLQKEDETEIEKAAKASRSVRSRTSTSLDIQPCNVQEKDVKTSKLSTMDDFEDELDKFSKFEARRRQSTSMPAKPQTRSYQGDELKILNSFGEEDITNCRSSGKERMKKSEPSLIGRRTSSTSSSVLNKYL